MSHDHHVMFIIDCSCISGLNIGHWHTMGMCFRGRPLLYQKAIVKAQKGCPHIAVLEHVTFMNNQFLIFLIFVVRRRRPMAWDFTLTWAGCLLAAWRSLPPRQSSFQTFEMLKRHSTSTFWTQTEPRTPCLKRPGTSFSSLIMTGYMLCDLFEKVSVGVSLKVCQLYPLDFGPLQIERVTVLQTHVCAV